MLFVELSYTLATEEAERIGVDHVARMSTSDTGAASTGNFIRPNPGESMQTTSRYYRHYRLYLPCLTVGNYFFQWLNILEHSTAPLKCFTAECKSY